ncbi:MAG: PA14 domain-containing protein [Patescibacteria group bacterium]
MRNILSILFFIVAIGSPAMVSAAVLDASQGRVEGLRGMYYDATGDPITRDERNADIAALRTDRTIAFRWTEQKPAPVESDFFTAEWKGDLRPPATGAYSFRVISDGAAALWINDDILVEGTPSELT